MRTLISGLVAALAVFSAPVAVAAPSSVVERAQPTGMLVTPASYCWEEGSTCTALTPNLDYQYTNERTAMTASLVSLRSGARLPLNFYNDGEFIDWNPELLTRGALPPGAYRLRVTLDTPGKWECSEYDPDGCTYFDHVQSTIEYRWVYAAGSVAKVRRYVAPETRFVGSTVKRKKGAVRLVKGKLVGSVERPGYVTTKSGPLAGRIVVVAIRKSGRWATVARVKTRGDGTFRAQVALKQNRAYKWRITTAAKKGSPAASAGTATALRE